MGHMTAKEYLRQYEELNRRARRLKAEYETELEKIDAIGSTLASDGTPHGTGVSKRTEIKAIRLADKALAWKEIELEAIAKRQEIFDLIYNISGLEGEILFERYVNLRKWEQICVQLNISWNAVHYNHRKALAIVQNRLDNLV